MSSNSQDDMLVDLQTRLTFQEQTINELNTVITDQQLQIDLLHAQVVMLNNKLEMLEESVDTKQEDEKPPHY